jgi:hypothetical protein
MATTTRGIAILKFGNYTIATYVVNDADAGIEGDEFILDDEDGQNITHFDNFGLNGTITLNLIPLAPVSPATTRPLPAISSVVTYNGRSASVKSANEITTKRQPLVWRLTLRFVPGITYA